MAKKMNAGLAAYIAKSKANKVSATGQTPFKVMNKISPRCPTCGKKM